ncbi:MAG: endonuclease V [Candidatus Nanohaloarchaea archaeon]|nr:endonuclease V [Candidatus Nanohaloarchaea archaeon]
MEFHDAFYPDPELGRDEQEEMQRTVAARAVFEDRFDWQEPDVVAGIDQAFVGNEQAVSAAVVLQDGEVVERVRAAEPLRTPYIPGLLALREGEAIVSVLERMDADPDLLMLDGSGRIHFRQAGIATHIGVYADVPAVGVAKNLLCGEPEQDLDQAFEQGTRIPVHADHSVENLDDEVIGYAYQSKQFDDTSSRSINPLLVSPGHRVGNGTAVNLVEAFCDGYKLPEPTRLADRYCDEVKEAR